MDKKEIKEKIYWYELNNSGLRKINMGEVRVLNLRVRKREKRVYADIILIQEDKQERYNDCYYSFGLLGIKK